jgi:hypothetical protein
VPSTVIHVLSDDGELWSFDPATSELSFQRALGCEGASTSTFSMAVDPSGRAWVLFVDSHDLLTADLRSATGCDDPGYEPDPAGFGLFGMTFAGDVAGGECARLYLHSYSGAGPFREGPGLGSLGVHDPETHTTAALASIDFDGGELASAGEGRLFAFAGAGPAKLVEYDEATGAEVAVTPLDGLHKTGASAFAYFGGEPYFFTEARPAACDPCLADACGEAAAACAGDPACAADLACGLAAGDLSDACGGSLPEALQTCLFGACASDCFPDPEDRVSQVSRREADGAMTLVVAQAPIRVVGASASPCAPQDTP